MQLISLIDIKMVFPDFDTKRLVEWQKRGLIRKLINKWYLFSEVQVTGHLLFRIANCLHRPSYISLESALSYYSLIPEAVFAPQSVSTRRTISYFTDLGQFNYKTIRPAFYFGYEVLVLEGFPVLIAGMEKALLDYLYLNPGVRSMDDLLALRWNRIELESRLDVEKLDRFTGLMDSPALKRRVNLLKKFISNA
ncbi:MAG TPA: hypothetical protein VMV20_02185 [Chitinophagaceae bacterium]|nr:hypothetical protein [Chitinophagaceae bacterium]